MTDPVRRPPSRFVPLFVAVVVVAAHAQLLAGSRAGDARRSAPAEARAVSLEPLAHLRGDEEVFVGAALRDDVWRPAASFLLAVQERGFGGSAWGHHLVSLLLLAGWAAGIAGLVRAECSTGPAITAVAALAVVLHPAVVEVVAWLPAQGTLLGGALTLAALAAWRRPGGRATGLGAALLVGALLSDPLALAFPAWFALSARGATAATTRRQRTILALGLTLAALMARDALVTAQGPGVPLGALLRGAAAGVATYATWWTVPVGFHFDTAFEVPATMGAPLVVVGAGLLATAVLAGVRAARRGPSWMAFGCLGAIVGVVLVVLGARPPERLAAEYLLPGFLPPLALLLAGGLGSLPRSLVRVALPVGGALVGLLLVAAVGRAHAWRDELTLWSAVQAERPEHEGASLAIARERARRDDLRGAFAALGHVVEARPLDAALRVEVGDLLGRIHAAEGVARGLGLQGRRGLQLQAAAYQEALDVWARRVGALGPQEAVQQAYALARLFELGLELGDLDLARTSLVLRLRRAWPAAADATAAFAAAGWPAERDRLRLALRALQPPPDDVPPAQHVQARARALDLAGFDARETGADLLAPWAEAMDRVRAAMEADVGRAPDRVVYLDLARAYHALGDADRAEAMQRAAAALERRADP